MIFCRSGLLPAIIAELPAASPTDHEWGVRLVTSHVERSSERRAEVMALLANEPSNPTIDLLRALSRRSGCTVCSPIEVYPETAAQRDSLAGLRSLGLGAQRDLLECPSCESLFRWESADGIGGSLSRVPDLVYFALRACVHPAGAISRYAMSAVYNFGETWAQLMFRHALHQDRELLRPFLADMEKAVKRQPDHWLRAFLDELTDANTP